MCPREQSMLSLKHEGWLLAEFSLAWGKYAFVYRVGVTECHGAHLLHSKSTNLSITVQKQPP